MKTILYGNEYVTLHDSGMVERSGWPPSGQWVVTGAVRFNNFGRAVERFTLQDVLSKRIAWVHKNGKQRVHITDVDHGTPRVWMSPTHRVVS